MWNLQLYFSKESSEATIGMVVMQGVDPEAMVIPAQHVEHNGPGLRMSG